MSENPAPAFTGGRNVAIKVPEHAFEATVAFYRDTLALSDGLRRRRAPRRSSSGRSGCGSTACRIWRRARCGSSWWPPTRRRPRQHLAAAGVVRCDEVEKLPPDLDGFWILNPAGIVHLVCSPEAEELADGGATRDAVERDLVAARSAGGGLPLQRAHRPDSSTVAALDLEGSPARTHRASAAPSSSSWISAASPQSRQMKK